YTERSTDALVRFYRLAPKGIANAMNEGVRLARGDYLIHLHSDDYLYDDDVLRDVAAFLETHDYDWIYGKEKHVLESENKVMISNMPRYLHFSYLNPI